MPLLVINQQELRKVLRKGVVTVPVEMASVRCKCLDRQPCNGLSLMGLPLTARHLQAELLVMGSKFVHQQEIRGYVMASPALMLHGPWPSYEFTKHLADVMSPSWDEAEFAKDEGGDPIGDPRQILSTVFERDADGPYVDYLLTAHFLFPEHQQITDGGSNGR